MNNQNFTYLMQNIATIDAEKTDQLDVVINEYPYFQIARAIQLKGLNQTKSFKYNQALKKTAAHTIDRSVLFDFITSQNFIYQSDTEILEEIDYVNTVKQPYLEEPVAKQSRSKQTAAQAFEDLFGLK